MRGRGTRGTRGARSTGAWVRRRGTSPSSRCRRRGSLRARARRWACPRRRPWTASCCALYHVTVDDGSGDPIHVSRLASREKDGRPGSRSPFPLLLESRRTGPVLVKAAPPLLPPIAPAQLSVRVLRQGRTISLVELEGKQWPRQVLHLDLGLAAGPFLSDDDGGWDPDLYMAKDADDFVRRKLHPAPPLKSSPEELCRFLRDLRPPADEDPPSPPRRDFMSAGFQIPPVRQPGPAELEPPLRARQSRGRRALARAKNAVRVRSGRVGARHAAVHRHVLPRRVDGARQYAGLVHPRGGPAEAAADPRAPRPVGKSALVCKPKPKDQAEIYGELAKAYDKLSQPEMAKQARELQRQVESAPSAAPAPAPRGHHADDDQGT